MERIDVFNELVKIITPYSKNPEALKNVSDETRFTEDLQINSARLVDIILGIESEFDISIDDDSADKLRTIGDAVNLIIKNKS